MNLIFYFFFAKELFEAYEMIMIIFQYILITSGKIYETHTLTLQKQMTSLCVYERVCVFCDIVNVLIYIILYPFLSRDRFEGASWGNAFSTALFLPVCVIISVYVCEKENIHGLHCKNK